MPGFPLRCMQTRALDLFKAMPIFLMISEFKPVLLRLKWTSFWLYLMKLYKCLPSSRFCFS